MVVSCYGSIVQLYRHSFLVLASVLFAAAPLAAQPALAAAPAASQPGFAASLERVQLANGLRVVMDRRPETGIVSVCSVWDVGSRNETAEAIGYARLVEQLAKRTDEVEARIAERGGSTWSTTEVDRTIFCTTVPTAELPIAVWAEASRLQPLRTPAVLFERERDRAVARLLPPGMEAPRARGQHLLYSLAFQGWWRFERTPQTSLLDLTVRDLAAVERFHQRYYRADNVVFSFSGNFDATHARAQLDEQLDMVRPLGTPQRYAPPTPPPRHTSERFAAQQDDGLGTPLVFFAYTIVGQDAEDHRALELAAQVLGGGPAATLHDQLVVRQRQARAVRAWVTQHRSVGALVVEISFTKAATMKRVELVLGQQLRRLRVAGPTQAELVRARAGLVSRLLDHAQTSQQRAQLFGEWELTAGDAGQVARQPQAYAAISLGRVRQALRDHIDLDAPSIVEVHPPGWYTPGDAKPPPRVHIVDRGETLIGIAKRYGISVSALTRENKIQRDKPIFPGQTLKLPKGAKDQGASKRGKKSSSLPAKPRVYEVKKGQTLSGIAHQHGVTTTALARANGLDPKRPIRVGQKLVIPPKATPAESPEAKPASSRSSRSGEAKPASKETKAEQTAMVHVVQKGQTLGGIAHRYGITTTALARANGLDPKRPIRVGQKLGIPPKATPTEASEAKPASSRSSRSTEPKSASKETNAEQPTETQPTARVHVVQKGQTLGGIARANGISTAELARFNGIDPKKPIRTGQRIKIPAPQRKTVPSE